MSRFRLLALLASAVIALILGLFVNIAATQLVPSFENKGLLVWSIIGVAFAVSVVLAYFLEPSDSAPKEGHTPGVQISRSRVSNSKVAGRDIVEGGTNKRQSDDHKQ